MKVQGEMASVGADGSVTVSPLRSCAACGMEHATITFKLLAQPRECGESIYFTHWAPCPTCGDPILLRQFVPQFMPQETPNEQ